MDLGLKGKIAVVSGSTAGIGLAIAAALAGEGAHVVLNGRTDERVTAAVEPFSRNGTSASCAGPSGGAVSASSTTGSPPWKT